MFLFELAQHLSVLPILLKLSSLAPSDCSHLCLLNTLQRRYTADR